MRAKDARLRVGIDTGGTFTDFIVLRETGRIDTFKLPSNPADPASVILDGLRRAAGTARADVVHGSTVATNALLERKGARTALVTTAGFEDVIEIGRQNRAELYNLTPSPRRMLIDRALRFGVGERAYFDGTIARLPQAMELQRLREQLEAAGVESVAICFLHAYRVHANEAAVAEALRGIGYVCTSHEVSPEFREYERTSTTAVNAYVGPLMERYLTALARECPHRIAVMQSNGGFLDAATAGRNAVRTLLSGPAGGVIGALGTARLCGFTRVLGFDMGGTSTDVSLCDGAPRETTEAYIDGLPVRVPMLDMHTVGAGGGSIARVDEGGLLRVGPESAGAVPGPACYGTGEQATVTDAHVVLGRIAADQLVGGELKLHVERAFDAVARVGEPLGLSADAAAAGIVRVADANMQRAIRAVSVERGFDARDFALVAFGGCGGLHACEMAAELGIATVIVPEYAGALSALGMLLADNVRDYAAGVLNSADMEAEFARLEDRARTEMPGAKLSRFADMRYAGQSYELTVPWSGARTRRAFNAEHARAYGYSDASRAIEIVTIRVRAALRTTKPRLLQQAERTHGGKTVRRRVYTGRRWHDVPVLTRSAVARTRTRGPALIVDYGSTTLIPPGWTCVRARGGSIVARRA